jgi:two-component system response regulator RpaA
LENGTKKSLSTGQIAKICDVAPRTVAGWIDSGLLPGYRIPLSRPGARGFKPGDSPRRVYAKDLAKFLHDRGMGRLLEGEKTVATVLCVGLGCLWCGSLAEALPEGWAVERAESVWEAGGAYWRTRPAAVVLAYAVMAADCREIAAAVLRENPPGRCIAIRPEDKPEGWLGVAGVVEIPACGLTAAALAELVTGAA